MSIMTSSQTTGHHFSLTATFACLVLAGLDLTVGIPSGARRAHPATREREMSLQTCSRMCASERQSQHCLVLGDSIVVNGSCMCQCAACKYSEPFCPDVSESCLSFGLPRTTATDDQPLCCLPCLEESHGSFANLPHPTFPMAPPSRFQEEVRGPNGELIKNPFGGPFFPNGDSTVHVGIVPTTSQADVTTAPASLALFCFNKKCPAVKGCVAYKSVSGQCCPKCVDHSCNRCPPVEGCVRFKRRKPGQCCPECAKRKKVTPAWACATAHCPRNRVCRNHGGKAVCVCKMACPKSTKYVCGSDWVTYNNVCHMKRASCLTGKPIWWVHKGRC